MKEAAGEANLTVIAVILIGVVMAIALPLITNMMGNIQARSECTNNGGVWEGNECK
jgi:uncharacterized membrane protein YadS